MIDPLGAAESLLSSFVTRFTELGGTVPVRKYVTMGGVPFDCEQLVVTCVNVYPGQPGQPSAGQVVQFRPNATVFIATTQLCLVRPAPTTTDPTRLNAAGHARLAELNLVVQALVKVYTDGASCSLVAIGSTAAVGPEGGMVGIVSTLELGLG